MRRILFCLLIIVSSCSENPENLLRHINGYWEIQEVILSDGTKREYSINETIDYIKIDENLKGFRKKMKPGLNDTYFTSEDAEGISAKFENNQLILQYTTPYANWNETVLSASEEILKIVNDNNVVYLYRRYQPINLEFEE